MKNVIVLLLAILILGNVSIFSQRGQGEMDGNRIKAVLKLTPEQEKKFDDLKYQHQQGAIDIRAKIQKNRLELKKLINDGKIEEKKILQLTNDNSKLQGDIKLSAVKCGLDIYKILNDEQKMIWTKHISRMIDTAPMKGRMKAGYQKMMNKHDMKNKMGQGLEMDNMMCPRCGMR